MSLAYLGLWPWLEIFKATGHGLSHGFEQNFIGLSGKFMMYKKLKFDFSKNNLS